MRGNLKKQNENQLILLGASFKTECLVGDGLSQPAAKTRRVFIELC
jgi:hypothetical protein